MLVWYLRFSKTPQKVGTDVVASPRATDDDVVTAAGRRDA